MFQGTPSRFKPPRPPMSWGAAGVNRPTATGAQRPWWANGGTHQMQTRGGPGYQLNPQGQPYRPSAQPNPQGQVQSTGALPAAWVGSQPSPYGGERPPVPGAMMSQIGQPPQQPGQQQPGDMTTINSGFNPAPLFSPQQTEIGAQQIQNQGIQSAFSAGNRYGLPGFASYSPTVLSRAAADAGQSMAQAGAGAEQLRMGDRLANQQHLLAGQIGRVTDFLGQGTNAAAFDAINRNYSNQAAGGMLGAIMAQQGGINNDLMTGLGDRQWLAGMGLGTQQLGANNWLQQMQMANQMMDFRNLNQQQQPTLSSMMWA